MQYQTFAENTADTFSIAILAGKLSRDEMEREYIEPTLLDPADVIAYTLHMPDKKTKVAIQKEYLDELLPILSQLEVKYLIVTDGDYFKTLTGVNKADSYLGYVLPNAYPEDAAGQFNVLFAPNYRQVFYDPHKVRAKILQAMQAHLDHSTAKYADPGQHIIHFAEYPSTVEDIGNWLDRLIEMDCPLACDIEGFSLKHVTAGIGTISFAWSKHEGIAFAVDLGPDGVEVRELLVNFFMRFWQKMTYHHISYDVTVLIYQLFMENLTDTEGLLSGLEIMLRNWDDTKLISYLATNSCAGNKLGLKEQAQEFAGNYAVEDIKDITLIPLPELLEYNLVDSLSTWFVKEKHWDTLVADDQLEIYTDLFKPAIVDIIQMQLTGMPVNMDEVAKAKIILKTDLDDAITRIQAHTLIREYTYNANVAWVEKRNTELKVKRVSMADAKESFNPGSGPQLIKLLFDQLDLPVLEKTKTKQPKTSGEVLEKLTIHTDDPEVKLLLKAILDYKAVEKIYSTFIPALEGAVLGPDGVYYLFGNFNLGGTVSGRLSSSKPNLQTIPSGGTKYAKIIKMCFYSPPGFLMVGLDFFSLEDKISGLTSKDPNRLKVYTDGYDGHSLRAFSYFPERMPDIMDTVESINKIPDLYPDERQESKVPTFLLTYQGTYIGLMAKCGFTESSAKSIEARYHQLYAHSDKWVADRLDEASKTGYITAAFGLRVRTPLLKQVIRGNSGTPYEAEAEGRTAGNALGQSWCLLNSRASVEFMRKVRKSKYRNVIRPIAHIHDAQYFLIPDNIHILRYVNEHLVAAVEWQEHPDIAHPSVKLGGKLVVFYPNWATEIKIPNGATEAQIYTITEESQQSQKAIQ